jgi:adenosylcobinamide-phosphate synthase
MLALTVGLALDFIIGDPPGWPHAARAMGALIKFLENRLYAVKNKRLGGTALALAVIIICVFSAIILLRINKFFFEALLCWQFLALKSLKDESEKVCDALKENDLPKARTALAKIVGRDTENLDAPGIIRATVETVAENASDGVIAPLFYIALGGAPLGALYKAANTMDSMIGYKNERYIDFGRFAAKLDDALNYIPSRLCAVLIIAAARICGMDAKNAARIWKRDRRNHASPNSAQTEAAAAGALRVRLAGNAYYSGKLYEKPFIGDDLRPVEPEDVYRANKLTLVSSVFAAVLAIIARAVLDVKI